MQQAQLVYKSSRITYYKFGKGEKILFCLHGYGENALSFSFLEKYIDVDFTVYAVDFPFHGNTEWKEDEPLRHEDLLEIFDLIHSTQKFYLLAYSMGGRVAMNILQFAAEKVERVALIAPDGLHANFWYKLATQNKAGNKLFRYTMPHPKWFFIVLNTGEKIKLLNKSITKFVHYFLDDINERTLLYKRWTAMRKLTADPVAIKRICNDKKITLNIMFGKYDRIILSKRANNLQSKMVRIYIVDAGHQLLKEKYAEQIVALLYN